MDALESLPMTAPARGAGAALGGTGGTATAFAQVLGDALAGAGTPPVQDQGGITVPAASAPAPAFPVVEAGGPLADRAPELRAGPHAAGAAGCAVPAVLPAGPADALAAAPVAIDEAAEPPAIVEGIAPIGDPPSPEAGLQIIATPAEGAVPEPGTAQAGEPWSDAMPPAAPQALPVAAPASPAIRQPEAPAISVQPGQRPAAAGTGRRVAPGGELATPITARDHKPAAARGAARAEAGEPGAGPPAAAQAPPGTAAALLPTGSERGARGETNAPRAEAPGLEAAPLATVAAGTGQAPPVQADPSPATATLLQPATAPMPPALAPMPALPDTAAAPRPMPRMAPAEQVAPVAIALSLGGGKEGRIALILDPAELGRVEVTVERVGDAARVHVAAERPETLALLARDGAALDRALGGAGIGTEGGRSLGFSLLGGDGGGPPMGGGSQEGGQRSGRAWRGPEHGADGAQADLNPERRAMLGLLDIAI